MAIGNMRAAAALLVTNELIKAVAKYTAPYRPASVISNNNKVVGQVDVRSHKKYLSTWLLANKETTYLQDLNLVQQLRGKLLVLEPTLS